MQIYLGFLLAFLFAFGIAISLMITIYLVENKMKFLEIASEYVMEIQQARRFEKNYFLYCTNLQDALKQVYLTKTILEKNSDELIRVTGDKRDKIIPHLMRYEELLKDLTALEREARETASPTFGAKQSSGGAPTRAGDGLLRPVRDDQGYGGMVARSRDIHLLHPAPWPPSS